MTIEQRLEQLEKELARTKRLVRWIPGITVLVCLLVAGLFEPVATRLFAQQNQRPGAVKATAFILVDDDGNIKAQLGMNPGGPALTLNDSNGEVRAMLGVSDAARGLVVTDSNGMHAWLGVSDESRGLAVTDSKGIIRASIHISDDGPSISLNDINGAPRALFLGTDADAILALFDSKGQATWQAP